MSELDSALRIEPQMIAARSNKAKLQALINRSLPKQIQTVVPAKPAIAVASHTAMATSPTSIITSSLSLSSASNPSAPSSPPSLPPSLAALMALPAPAQHQQQSAAASHLIDPITGLARMPSEVGRTNTDVVLVGLTKSPSQSHVRSSSTSSLGPGLDRPPSLGAGFDGPQIVRTGTEKIIFKSDSFSASASMSASASAPGSPRQSPGSKRKRSQDNTSPLPASKQPPSPASAGKAKGKNAKAVKRSPKLKLTVKS